MIRVQVDRRHAPTAAAAAAAMPTEKVGAMMDSFDPLRRLVGSPARVNCAPLSPAEAKTLSDMTVFFSSAEWNYIVEDEKSTVNGMVDTYNTAKLFVLAHVKSKDIRELVVEIEDDLDADGYMPDGVIASPQLAAYSAGGADSGSIAVLIALFDVWTIEEGDYNINRTKKLVVLKRNNINITADSDLAEGLVPDTEMFCDFCIRLDEAIIRRGHKEAGRDRVLLFFLALAARSRDSLDEWLKLPHFSYLKDYNRTAVAQMMDEWRLSLEPSAKRDRIIKNLHVAVAIAALFRIMCFGKQFNQYVPNTATLSAVDAAQPAEDASAAVADAAAAVPQANATAASGDVQVSASDVNAIKSAISESGSGLCAHHSRGDAQSSPCTPACMTLRLGPAVTRTRAETDQLRVASQVFAMAGTQLGSHNAGRGALIGSLIGNAFPEHAQALLGTTRTPTRCAKTVSEWNTTMSVLDNAKVNSSAKLEDIDTLARHAKWANAPPVERAKRYVAAYSGCSMSDLATMNGWSEITGQQRAAVDAFKKTYPVPGLRTLQVLDHMSGSDFGSKK